jgi:hypothetical protein
VSETDNHERERRERELEEQRRRERELEKQRREEERRQEDKTGGLAGDPDVEWEDRS